MVRDSFFNAAFEEGGYLFGALFREWMKSRRGKIVAIMIMIVIVLLNSGGGYLRVGMCCRGVRGEGELNIA